MVSHEIQAQIQPENSIIKCPKWVQKCPKVSFDNRNSSSYSSANTGARITIGQPAKSGSWPWIVRLIINKGTRNPTFCSATIIESNYLLTAADCCRKDAVFSDVHNSFIFPK